MSLFSAMFASAGAPVFEHFKDAAIITYENAAGTQTENVDAIVGNEDKLHEVDERGAKLVRTRTFTVPTNTSDNATWTAIADAEVKGVVIYAGERWQVVDVDAKSENFMGLMCRRTERVQIARQGAIGE